MVYDVYMFYDAFLKVIRHAEKHVPKEVLGYLFGNRYKWKDREYTVIKYAFPVRAHASEYYVEPREGELAKMADIAQRKYKVKLMVGWFHSHPGYGCFLSDVDLDSQRRYFFRPYHVALVVDPVRREFAFFKLKGNDYDAVPCQIIRKVKRGWNIGRRGGKS